MKINVLILSILASSLTQVLFSQNLKTYNGPYENGTAVYQYYEDENFERIYQGPFKYSAEGVTITGQFSKNKRNGKWVIVKNFEGMGIFGDPYKETINENYLNGDKVGNWSLKRIDSGNKVIENSNIEFIDNKLINKFSYSNKEFKSSTGQIYEVHVNGNFNRNGFFDGEWRLTYFQEDIPHEDIRRFKNGVMYWKLLRNSATGNIIERTDNSEILLKYLNKSDSTYSIPLNICRVIPRGSETMYSDIFRRWEDICSENFEFSTPYIRVHSTEDDLKLPSLMPGLLEF